MANVVKTFILSSSQFEGFKFLKIGSCILFRICKKGGKEYDNQLFKKYVLIS